MIDKEHFAKNAIYKYPFTYSKYLVKGFIRKKYTLAHIIYHIEFEYNEAIKNDKIQ